MAFFLCNLLTKTISDLDFKDMANMIAEVFQNMTKILFYWEFLIWTFSFQSVG
jgi:hypothetical protein